MSSLEFPLKGEEAGDNLDFPETHSIPLLPCFSCALHDHYNDIDSIQASGNSEMSLILIGTEITYGCVVIYLNCHVQYKILFIYDGESKVTIACTAI
jgi:hypothetical protein